MSATYSENNRRIAKNTLLLYGRMFFAMLVSLYTSRVILQALGVEDYGIYNVVGGIVAMFSLLSGSLSAAVSRFLTFELGAKNYERLKIVFSTSVTIHIVLILIVVVLSETLGLWFLNNYMNIPIGRMNAANWVFQCSLISFSFNLLNVPYNASIISHERMDVFAFMGIFDILLKLVITLFIAYSDLNFDRLIVYAILLVLEVLIIRLSYFLFCKINFSECRYGLIYDKMIFREMLRFAGWNFIGSSAVVLRDHGVNIILNIFYGPLLNAARGIALQVNGAVSGFVGNFMTAVNPQITKLYATGDTSYLYLLIYKTTRFSFFLLLIISMPILMNTSYVLYLWLQNVPEHTVLFVRLVLVFTLFESLSYPLITLLLAIGKIKKYQIIVGSMQMLNLPLSYLLLNLGAFPEIVMIVAISISVICLYIRLVLLSNMIRFPMKNYISNVICNIIIVSILSLLIPILYSLFYFQNTFSYFVSSVIVSLLSSFLVVLFVGCNKSERNFCLGKIKKI